MSNVYSKNNVLSEKIVTTQMVRDVLTLHGSCSLTELLARMRLDEEFRATVHCSLVELYDARSATYDVDSGVWYSQITLR